MKHLKKIGATLAAISAILGLLAEIHETWTKIESAPEKPEFAP